MILTETQKDALSDLYYDGAWTGNELYERLTQEEVDAFLGTSILMTLRTEMGVMTLLGPPGRKLSLPTLDYAYSVTRQLDFAYVRLCAQELGWWGPNFEVERDFRELAPSTFRQYNTPDGPALVVGKITEGGYSLKGMTTVIDRLRAVALAYTFRVIILTPRTRRGETLAAHNRAFLRVLHYLPNAATEGGHPPRIQRVTAEETTDPGPAITPHIARLKRAEGVPDLTLSILQLTRAERAEQLRADLAVDGVISAGQIAAHYALDHGDLPGTIFVKEIVRPVHGRPDFELYQRFYCKGRAEAGRNGSNLGNQAGTGEVRRLLSAPADPEEWQLEPRNKHRTDEPDATWLSPDGPVLVEYDSGFYSATTIAFKVDKFRQKGAARIVWGLPSSLRGRRLQERFGVEPKVCQWWGT